MAAGDYEDVLRVSDIILGVKTDLLMHVEVRHTRFRMSAARTAQHQSPLTFVHILSLACFSKDVNAHGCNT
jgi:hypothetical protein